MTTFITPMSGVGSGPRLAVKDLIDVIGTPTTAGCKAVADHDLAIDFVEEKEVWVDRSGYTGLRVGNSECGKTARGIAIPAHKGGLFGFSLNDVEFPTRRAADPLVRCVELTRSPRTCFYAAGILVSGGKARHLIPTC